MVRQWFPYNCPFAFWTRHLSIGTYSSVCGHAFSDFRAITSNVRALPIQFWTLHMMCCCIFIDAFPSAVPIATLDGQCSGDLVQGDVIFQWLAIAINTTFRAFASWTFYFNELFDTVLASYPEWPQLKLTGFNIGNVPSDELSESELSTTLLDKNNT